jgi:hypothetical protein
MTKEYDTIHAIYLLRTNSLQGYKKVSPLFVPRLLINLAAGHVSMRFGFKVNGSTVFEALYTD